MSLPTIQDNPDGLHQRYVVSKADGTPVDPDATYLVLRIDKGGDDKQWVEACRLAATTLHTFMPTHMKQVGVELKKYLEETT